MKAVKGAIILSWIMLIVCFIIKLFGGNWFEIMCDNEHFIHICEFIDAHIWLQDIIAFILYIPSTTLMTLACSNIPNPNSKQLLIVLVFFSICWVSKFISLLVKMILEMSLYMFIPVLLNLLEDDKTPKREIIKDNWYRGILGIGFCFGFQAVSVTIRDLGIKFVGDNTLVALILMIDYYIMVILYYLYIRLKKGVKDNGQMGTFSFQ